MPMSNRRGLHQLVRPRALIPLIVVLAGVSIVLFPDQREWRLLSDLSSPDALSATYLRLLIDKQPEDGELKLKLAQRLMQQGEWDEAQALAISVASRRDAVGQRARLMSMQIHLASANSLPTSHPERRERLRQVSQALEPLSEESLPASQLIELAETSLALERPDIAARLYESLASSDPANGQRWTLSAARWHEGSGAPAVAAKLYDAASSVAGSKEEGKAHALKALATVQSAGDAAAALRLAEQYAKRYPADEQILRIAIELAMAESGPARARMWGRQLLALAPNSVEQIHKQLKLELAANDLGAALELARRLVTLQPERPALQAQAAQIAEWAGQPALALEQYASLARRQGSGAALDHALRLARGLDNGPLAIEMMTLRSRAQTLSDQELADLEWLYERGKDPQGWIEFLQSYVQRHPDGQVAWKKLAQTQERHGLLEDAARTWEQAAVRFGRSPEAALHQAGLLLQTGHRQGAFDALRRVRNDTPFDHVEYWQLFGNLAWDLERTDESLIAYRGLWQAGGADLLAAERLVLLAMRTNQPNLAITTAEQAYRRFREPRLMFVALETATQQADWDRLEHLLNVAGQDEASFSRSERYWLLKAHSESHAGRKSAALFHYGRALNLNPASKSARVGWLWLAIEEGDKQQLATSLRDWRNEADKDPAYWGAYAAALLALQRPRESLPWFERQARAKPNDYLWLLTYADALQRSGHESESWRLRRHVLLQTRREGLSARKGDTPGELALQKAYARLVNDFAGADAGGKAIQALLTQGPRDPQVREMLIAHHLSQENYGAARYWLMRAHSERQTTPAWQELALAFADDDMKAVERLLDERSLAPGDRIQALRRLGRDEQALVEAREYASGR